MAQAQTKAVIKNADMSEEMQADAIDCATQAGCSAFLFPRMLAAVHLRIPAES